MNEMFFCYQKTQQREMYENSKENFCLKSFSDLFVEKQSIFIVLSHLFVICSFEIDISNE